MKCCWTECGNNAQIYLSNISSNGELAMCKKCSNTYEKHLRKREIMYLKDVLATIERRKNSHSLGTVTRIFSFCKKMINLDDDRNKKYEEKRRKD